MEKRMKNEAVRRMKMLHIWDDAIQAFIDNDTVCFSDRGKLGSSPIGVVYSLDQCGEWADKVKNLEKKYDITVYHCIHEQTIFGECLDCLYVSSDTDEWEYDRLAIGDEYGEEKFPIAYVMNLTDDFCSEFGSIGIKETFGGLIRTA